MISPRLLPSSGLIAAVGPSSSYSARSRANALISREFLSMAPCPCAVWRWPSLSPPSHSPTRARSRPPQGPAPLRPMIDGFAPEDAPLLEAFCTQLEGKAERQKIPIPEPLSPTHPGSAPALEGGPAITENQGRSPYSKAGLVSGPPNAASPPSPNR
ncbi:exported hypothetical protein [Magnetospirillum sp. UT-4]|nr:exported hypothetical protein [Magnetospirillum sp. UT-4]